MVKSRFLLSRTKDATLMFFFFFFFMESLVTQLTIHVPSYFLTLSQLFVPVGPVNCEFSTTRTGWLDGANKSVETGLVNVPTGLWGASRTLAHRSVLWSPCYKVDATVYESVSFVCCQTVLSVVAPREQKRASGARTDGYMCRSK